MIRIIDYKALREVHRREERGRLAQLLMRVRKAKKEARTWQRIKISAPHS